MAIPVKLEVFEGSLDLLLHLLYKNKIDICKIPVAKVAGQYEEYICGPDEEELDIMSGFLMAAATLIDIKCRTLLPCSDEEEDEDEGKEVSAENLLQYQMYKRMALELKSREADAGRTLFRQPSLPAEVKCHVRPLDLDALLSGVTLKTLDGIFREVMRRKEDRTDPVHSRFASVRKERFPLTARLVYVENYAKEHKKFSFRRLLEREADRMQVAVTFLAVLQLVKSGVIRASQEEICGDITIDSLV